MKAISLIFNEHEKLSIENPLLKQQISSLEELNQLYVKTDSLQRVEISTYKDKVDHDAKTIKKLKFSQKISIAGGIILFILMFIGMHDECLMGHHEIDCDIDPNEDKK